MQKITTDDVRATHLKITEPSPWVARFSSLVPTNSTVLDLACGGGRHARHFLNQGHKAVLIDRNTDALSDLSGNSEAEIITFDMETGISPFGTEGPLHGRLFESIVVVNYLYRPLFPALVDALAPGGVLIYETFARGNEEFARPRNPDHLLKSGELLDLATGRLQVVAYEHGRLEVADIPGVKQRLCAVKDLEISTRDDGEPNAHCL